MSETLTGKGEFHVDIAVRKKLLAEQRRKLALSYLAGLREEIFDAKGLVVYPMMGCVSLLVLSLVGAGVSFIVHHWGSALKCVVAAGGIYLLGAAVCHCETVCGAWKQYKREMKSLYLE